MSEWNRQKLEQMIADQVEESLSLDYKRADSLENTAPRKAEIVRDVTAFANSSGGTIIYGIAEATDREKRHLPERLDPVRRSEISKEWLEQVIQTIQPRIDGVVVTPVPIEDDKIACYVVDIPQSHTAHQARDHIYYKRHNFNNLAMEDYEVRDVMQRKTHPSVSVTAQFNLFPRQNKDGKNGSLIYTIANQSDLLVLHYGIVVSAPFKVCNFWVVYDECIYNDSGENHCWSMQMFNRDGIPLFPQSQITMKFFYRVTAPHQVVPNNLLLDFKHVVFADSMPKQRGIFKAEDILNKM